MAKQLTDDEQNLKRKARSRLIGAFALTLAMVVILPMVLDSEPRPAVQDIELRIPAPDKAGEFVPGSAVSESVQAEPLSASAVEAASAPVPAVSAPAAASAPAVSAPAVAEAEPVALEKPQAVRETGVLAQARSQPAVSQQPVPDAAGKSVAGEGFVVQVGAYVSADAAKQEFDRLKKWGFRKAYTEKSDGMTRVRVGPYPEREKAEEVRRMLEKHGLKPAVMSAR